MTKSLMLLLALGIVGATVGRTSPPPSLSFTIGSSLSVYFHIHSLAFTP